MNSLFLMELRTEHLQGIVLVKPVVFNMPLPFLLGVCLANFQTQFQVTLTHHQIATFLPIQKHTSCFVKKINRLPFISLICK